LARDHKRSRAETFREVFRSKYKFKKWWRYVWEGDETVLVTKEENNNNTERNDDIKLNWQDGYFAGNHIGWKHRIGVEGKKVRELCEKHPEIGQ